jgi:hypothetical protein
MRAPQRLVPLLVFLTLFACSDDDGLSPEPGSTTTAAATISPRGGSLTVDAKNGTSLKVTVPRGALMRATLITLRAVDPPAGVKARFVIEPAGLDLNAAATFRVTLPDGATASPDLGFVFTHGESVHVPATIDAANRTLTATLYQLGFDAPPVSVAATAALTGDDNSFIDVDEMNCQITRDALTDQILRAQAFSGPFPPDLASPLIQEYRAALLICESEDSVSAASEILRQVACTNSNGAQSQVNALNITSAAELKENLGYLLSAEALVQVTGADCHVADNSIEQAFTEFIDAYVARINAPDFSANFPTWDSIWKELIPVMEVRGIADSFELPDMTARINAEVFPALFARLHDVASKACEDDANNSFLLDMARGGHNLNHPITPEPEFPAFTGFTQTEIVEELLTCGASFSAEARTSTNDLLGSTEVASGDRGSMRVTDAGKVLITDNTLGFTCGGVVSRGGLRVRAEIPEELPVVQLGTLAGSITINVSSMLTSLPAPEEGELPSGFDVVIERDRKICDIDEPGVIELARIHVSAQGFVTQMEGTWSGGCPNGGVNGTFTIQILDNGDVTGGYGGSGSGDIAGHVNGDGTFNAAANGTAGNCNWNGNVNLNDGIVSASGSWSCGGTGCSGEFSGSGAPPNARR